jgi:hypothetical protein
MVYIGAGGGIMQRSFAAVCQSFSRLKEMNGPLANRLKIELYGTTLGWTEGDPKPLEEVAKQYDVGDQVAESPGRVSYAQSLELLRGADIVLILGVDDPGYMPSKLFTHALSGKPAIASLHPDCPAVALFNGPPALGHLITFGGPEADLERTRQLEAVLKEAEAGAGEDRRSVLVPHLSNEMARLHANLFDRCISAQAAPVVGSPELNRETAFEDRL